MHQRAMGIRPDAFTVRAAPAQVIARRAARAFAHIAEAAQLNQSGDATHQSSAAFENLLKSHARGRLAGQVSTGKQA
jgi:hypothetical protein